MDWTSKFSRILIIQAALFVTILTPIIAAEGDLLLKDWEPKSQLVVKETRILRPKFPVIDVHNHLALFRGLDSLETHLSEMDKAGVWKCVSLDGFHNTDLFQSWRKIAPDFFREHLRVVNRVAPERVIVFYVPYYESYR